MKIPHVLTIRLASGVKTIPEAPHGTVSMLTLFWATGRPSRVYSHVSTGPRALSVARDLGWTDHSTLKIVQFHRYTIHQVQEAELFDDNDIIRQGGVDGGIPPGEDDIYGVGPRIESIHSDDDPADIPVPDADTDSDLDDDAFWVKWLDEIRADEYIVADKFMVTKELKGRADQEPTVGWCLRHFAPGAPTALPLPTTTV